MEDGYNFEEEEVDVWGESKDSSFKVGQSIEASSIRCVRKHTPTGTHHHHESNDVKQQQQQSAPVNIPGWYSNLSTETRNGSWHDDDEEEEEEEEYKSKLPPHEIIARRVARSKISSFSVLEGVGRKLKGRDLRKVRNAVLTKTGFLE